jgi:hypothetical protein
VELLGLGVKAAQAGLHGVAREHFRNALRQEPENTQALLWLAALAPTTEDSLRLFNRVLSLEPRNQQAIAGIHWLRRRQSFQHRLRLKHAGDQTIQTSNSIQAAEQAVSRTSTTLLSYAFKTLLVTLAIGFLALAIGMSAGMLVPLDLLAAWLPVSPESPKPAIALAAMAQQDEATRLYVLQKGDVIPAQSVGSSSAAPSQWIPALNIPPQHEEATLQKSAEPLPVSSANPATLIGQAWEPVDPILLPYQPVYEGEKWIEINVTTQEVTAWEENIPVMRFIASTGQPEMPTVLGQYNIYWKIRKTDMFGFDYYVPEVPYAMFFHGDYAIHGTYWHDLFGQRVSRGCVNLRIPDAKKLFEWAGPTLLSGQTETFAGYDNPGTVVVVHE